MSNDLEFVTIDRGALISINGGDGWDDYKKKVGDSAKATGDRWNEAMKHTYQNGNDPGKYIDNMAGAAFNAGETAWNATGGALFDIIGVTGGKK